MKITVKYYREINKEEMYILAMVGADVPMTIINGRAYRIEYWTSGKKEVTLW